MKIIEIKDRTLMLINELLVLWEDSVKATHSFLSIKEIENIINYMNINKMPYNYNLYKSIKKEIFSE